MPPEPLESTKSSEDRTGWRSTLGVAAYLLVPGERRRRAAGHFSRAAMEAARGVKALSVPSRPTSVEQDEGAKDTGYTSGGRQRIEIE